MELWTAWWQMVSASRSACSRNRSFMWPAIAVAGLCVRTDLLSVTSIVRELGLAAASYGPLLNFFHSSAIDPDVLAHHWSALVLRMFPDIPRFNGRLLLLEDGIKAPKSGRKMPAVKNCTKPLTATLNRRISWDTPVKPFAAGRGRQPAVCRAPGGAHS